MLVMINEKKKDGVYLVFFFFQAEDGIRDHCVTGVQTCALPISFPDTLEAVTFGVSATALTVTILVPVTSWLTVWPLPVSFSVAEKVSVKSSSLFTGGLILTSPAWRALVGTCQTPGSTIAPRSSVAPD